MNKWKSALIFIFLLGMMITLCSCARGANLNRKNETTLKLITSQELLQFIRENDVGVAEIDFEGIDIDDFIECWQIMIPSTGEKDLHIRLSTLRYQLDNYEVQSLNYRKSQLMARYVVSVDSTDDEYEAFIEAFLGEVSALGLQYEALGMGSDGLDNYIVFTEENRQNTFGKYHLYIGKTMDIHKHNIIIGAKAIALQIGGQGLMDQALQMGICYSQDEKFFLGISGPSGNSTIYFDTYKIFTEVTY